MVKVVKFGGSSLASAEQFMKVGKIIKSDESRKYVVPSAPGKRSSKDTKVTDMLYACYDLAEKDEDFSLSLRWIQSLPQLRKISRQKLAWIMLHHVEST